MKKHHLTRAAICLFALALGLLSCKNEAKEYTQMSNEKVVLKSTGYMIPEGGITDHSDASITGSIAWYMANYPGSSSDPSIFWLTSNNTYHCKGRFYMPAYSQLKGVSGTFPVLQCTSDWTAGSGDAEFIRMRDHCTLDRLMVDCNLKATIGVFVAAVGSVSISNVTVKESAHNALSRLIYLYWATNTQVDHCILRYANCSYGEANFDNRAGYCLTMLGGSDININNNDIGYCATAGIEGGATNNVTIDNNQIHDTGRSNTVADGITCYHQGSGSTIRNWYITYNTIYNNKNHGVHVSARGYHILHNTIYNCGTGSAASNVYIGDQRDPHDCTYDIEVNNNTFSNCPAGGGKSIQFNYYKSPYYVSGNTGCTTIGYANPCN